MAEIARFIAVFAYAAGSLVCHQLPGRSFHWGAWQFPVCARCTGLYLSGAIGLVAWAAFRKTRGAPVRIDRRLALGMLAAAALPTAASVLSAAAGGWDAGNAGRALLAAPLGATAGILVAAVAAKDLR